MRGTGQIVQARSAAADARLRAKAGRDLTQAERCLRLSYDYLDHPGRSSAWNGWAGVWAAAGHAERLRKALVRGTTVSKSRLPRSGRLTFSGTMEERRASYRQVVGSLLEQFVELEERRAEGDWGGLYEQLGAMIVQARSIHHGLFDLEISPREDR